MKVGELARKTGLTIRTLHHYDELGLLRPSRRTDAGHRVYSTEDVARLQQIMSLRAIGLSLQAIGDFLDNPGASLSRILTLQLRRLDEQIAEQQAVRRRLETMVRLLDRGAELTVDDFIQTIEAMTRFEKYYSEDQLKELDQRAKELGEEGMQRAQDDWQTIIDGMRREMEKGTSPDSDVVQRMADRALELIQAFTGGNAGIAGSLNRMYEEEGPEKVSQGMMDRGLWDYMQRAYEVARARKKQ